MEKMSSPLRLGVESPVQRRSASVSMTRSHLSLPLTAAGLTSFSASTSTTPNTPTHLMHPALALLKVRAGICGFPPPLTRLLPALPVAGIEGFSEHLRRLRFDLVSKGPVTLKRAHLHIQFYVNLFK
jgi:hypothetical protein